MKDLAPHPAEPIPCIHKEAMMHRGGHRTTSQGLIQILRTRSILRMDFAGVYALLTTDPVRLLDTMEKVERSNKNSAGAMRELRAHCHCVTTGRGGVYADEAVVKKGTAAHNTVYKRWSVPQEFISFVALWMPLQGKCLDDLPGFDVGFCGPVFGRMLP